MNLPNSCPFQCTDKTIKNDERKALARACSIIKNERYSQQWPKVAWPTHRTRAGQEMNVTDCKEHYKADILYENGNSVLHRPKNTP